MKSYAYKDGKMVPTEKMMLPITDIAILRGYAVFDYLKVYSGKPFLLREHIERLKNSVKRMGLDLVLTEIDLSHLAHELIQKNGMKDGALRLIVTGGKTIDGLSFNPENSEFIMIAEEAKPLDKKLYTHGGSLITHEHERMFFGVKTTNYTTAVSLQDKKRKQKAIEILYTYNKKVLEATTSNFFIFRKNTLVTPKNNILIGITRNFVIQLAKEAGFKVEERDILAQELRYATEAFITASNKEILPIVKIDSKKVGKGVVGENTKKLMKNFEDAVKAFLKE